MGFSYGYNRAEQLKDYHTGRELILILIDTVSRGGNLLLDIGPTGDGRIPVIMEQRLHEMGEWLRINGEAIHGTRPWSQSRQWSEGKQPTVDYNKEFKSTYDVAKLTQKSEPGKAVIDAFFTARPSAVYVILPRWPGKQFTVKRSDASRVKSVTLLGSDQTLKWRAAGDSISVELPDVPEKLMTQPAWVLKLAQ